jgi:hypothetical protein
MPELVTAHLRALSGDLGVLAATRPDGTSVQVVVRVAGYHWHNLNRSGDAGAWAEVQREQTWRIIDVGGPDRIPLVEPWIDGVPLGVAMRARGWVTGGTLGYPMTVESDPLPPTTLQQVSTWIDTLVVIAVAIGALVLLSIRDERARAVESAQGIRVAWWKRPFRWLVGPAFAQPIRELPQPPAPKPDQP